MSFQEFVNDLYGTEVDLLDLSDDEEWLLMEAYEMKGGKI